MTDTQSDGPSLPDNDSEIPEWPERRKEPKKRSWWQGVVDYFVDLAEDISQMLEDPVVANMIISDLGFQADLDAGDTIPQTERHQLRAFADANAEDITAESIAATVEAMKAEINALVALFSTLNGFDEDEAWRLIRKLAEVWTTERMRARAPTMYWAMKTIGLFDQSFGTVERFDLDGLTDFFAEADANFRGFDSYDATRVSDLFTFVVQQVLGNVMLHTGPDHVDPLSDKDRAPWLDSLYGWDTPPEHEGRGDVRVLERMLTVKIKAAFGDPGAGGTIPVELEFFLTLALVPVEHGGPGLFLSLGGFGEYSWESGETVLSMGAGSTGGLNLYIPLSNEGLVDHYVLATDDGNQSFTFSQRPIPAEIAGGGGPDQVPDQEPTTEPIIDWSAGPVFLKAHQLSKRLDVSSGKIAVTLDIIDGQLGVSRDTSALMKGLLRKDLEIDFGIGLTIDKDGVRLSNGSGFHTMVPLNRSAVGFTIHFVEVGLKAKENQAQTMEFSAVTSITFELGPFKAQFERFGMREYLAWGDGQQGHGRGFQPPKGIALAVRTGGGLRGGGYLFLDFDKNEYSGVMELTWGKFSIKAIGILTEFPDRPGGWAFIALITFEFPPWGPISGVGGLIGIQHGLSIDKLQNGIRTGVLDSILFPKDPLANPTQVINTIRTVFPMTPGALTIGLMLRLSFFAGKLEILLGLLMQWDNAIGDDDTEASLSRLSVIGRLQIVVPADAAKPKVKIILDVAGSYDFPGKLLSVDGRLRDSKIGAFSITGSGSVRDQQHRAGGLGLEQRLPSRIITVGGWHPRFKDLPDGVPKQDRVGFSIKSKKGAKTKYEVSLKSYYASTPNTTQIGLEAKAKASRWGFTILGRFSFDGIWYENPDYFELDIEFEVAVKRGSTTLLKIDLDVYLRGSGHWIFKGKGKFKILFFSKTISIHEEWGPPELPPVAEEILVEDLLAAAIGDRRNWNTQLPSYSEMLVTLQQGQNDDEMLAHPLGDLSFTQQVVPLGVEIEKLGEFVPAAATRFDITQVSIGSGPEDISTLKAYFSRNEFLELTEEQRLTAPSFELMTAGVRVDVEEGGYPVGDVVSAVPAHELKYRGRPVPPDAPPPAATDFTESFEMMTTYSHWSAAARSTVGRNRFGGGPDQAPVGVTTPPLVIVTDDTFEVVDDQPPRSYTEATQGLTEVHHQVVEAHELEAIS